MSDQSWSFWRVTSIIGLMLWTDIAFVAWFSNLDLFYLYYRALILVLPDGVDVVLPPN